MAMKKALVRRKRAIFICSACGSHLAASESVTARAFASAKALPLAPAKTLLADATARVLTLIAAPKDATTWSVTLDREQLALRAGQPSSRPILPGEHQLTARVWGDPGASLSVTGAIPANTGVRCSCTVGVDGKPAADPETFNVT